MNKHDIDNLKIKWDRFWLLSRYGQYNKGWSVVIGFVISSLLYYIWR